MKWSISPTHGVAIIILAAGFFRLAFGGDENGRFGETTLLYFFGAAAVFLLSRAKTFKFGDLELELEQLKEEVKEAKLVANIAQDSSKVERPPANALSPAAAGSKSYTRGSVPGDPWKAVFGGQSIDKANGRLLSADVAELQSARGWYSLTLRVTPTPGAQPLQGEVQFYLHDSFPNDRPVVKVMNNEAVLHLKAWGAFAVGAVCDGGKCELELDLAELQSAPVEFRSR
jgi:hypothetical protein